MGVIGVNIKGYLTCDEGSLVNCLVNGGEKQGTVCVGALQFECTCVVWFLL